MTTQHCTMQATAF